jgi:hypothetical protein
MALECNAIFGNAGPQCQDPTHPEDWHHAHWDGRCLRWADEGHISNHNIDMCDYPPANADAAEGATGV